MILLRNQEDLKRENKAIPEELIETLESELKTIEEEYPKYDDEYTSKYGPIVVLFDHSETRELKKMMPVITQITPEYKETVLSNENVRIKKQLFILTDTGIITYERFSKWSSQNV